MEWLDRMNNAVNYIEANLTDEISYDTAAQIAGCSTFYFQRMFSFIANVPLSEYIRRRRLTLAAFELQQANGVKIIDTALKYGYESAGAFSRAFKNLYGIMPSSVCKTGTVLKAYPKMTFSISIKGGDEIQYRIEQKEAFEVFGFYTEVSINMEQAFIDASEFLRKSSEDGTLESFNRLLGRPRDPCYHAALFDHTETSFKYMLCYYVSQGLEIPETYTRLKFPAQTWVIFPAPGGDTPNVWRRIYSEWLPASGYEWAEAPDIEVYLDDNPVNMHYEVWLPIVKKA